MWVNESLFSVYRQPEGYTTHYGVYVETHDEWGWLKWGDLERGKGRRRKTWPGTVLWLGWSSDRFKVESTCQKCMRHVFLYLSVCRSGDKRKVPHFATGQMKWQSKIPPSTNQTNGKFQNAIRHRIETENKMFQIKCILINQLSSI